jgi:ArsR family transcriptional regulator, arsenate/arsenite/antimonite-responsive transcriptional repressor
MKSGTLPTMERDIRTAARLKALGHPVRLGIALRLAAEPETCACDFAEVFGVSQPTISGHLRVMREAGLVTTRRRGTQICYSLDPGAVRGVREALAGLSAPALRSA